MFAKSTDRRNDTMVTQLACRVRFQRKWTSKTVSDIEKKKQKQIDNNFLWSTLIFHRNDVKMFKTSQWNHKLHLRFEQSDAFSMVDKSVDHGKLLSIC